jgi:hypothetical protein
MLIRMPPEPPEQWRTVQAAIQTRDKTLRLCLILLVRSFPFVLVLATVLVLALTKQ